ncbi:MAG: hypothetical protein ACE5D0_01370 [Fidelibacterota bacterium]
MNRILLLVTILVLIGCGSDVDQKSISLVSEIDTTTSTIGDIIHYSIQINGIDDQYVVLNAFEKPDALELRKSNITYMENGYLNEMQFVFWDTGRFAIPSFDFAIMNSDSTMNTQMQTDPISVLVVSSTDPTMAGAMKPVKDPVPVSIPINRIIVIWTLLLIISLAVMIWLSFKYKKEPLMGNPTIRLPSPDEVAIGKINLLKTNKEFQTNPKELYVQISYILREYVESSLFYKTLEMTTNEIQDLKNHFPFSEQEMKEWITLLNRSDMIKYAKMIPETQTWMDDLTTAEQFIKSTTPYWKRVGTSGVVTG